MTNQCVIFIANRAYALSNSRLFIIKHFISRGWRVILATCVDEESRKICGLGAELEPVSFHRGGLSVKSDYLAYRRIFEILQKWEPALIHSFHAKPVILGSLAVKKLTTNKPRVVNTITGLGYAFSSGGIHSRIAGCGYRISLSHSDHTVFQNRDDLALFLEMGWVSEGKTSLIVGSGVDTSRFSISGHQMSGGNTTTVVMMGRLLKQKGVVDFAEVAKRIQNRWPDARFLLAGEEDPNHPDAVDNSWLAKQKQIQYLGRLEDVVPLLNDSDILLFPSSYREGVPRAVLEASSMGLPTVAYDLPGMREVVINRKTGFLVSPHNVDALTDSVATLIEDQQLRIAMGDAARKMVENQFDIHAVKEQYLDVYRSLELSV